MGCQGTSSSVLARCPEIKLRLSFLGSAALSGRRRCKTDTARAPKRDRREPWGSVVELRRPSAVSDCLVHERTGRGCSVECDGRAGSYAHVLEMREMGVAK